MACTSCGSAGVSQDDPNRSHNEEHEAAKPIEVGLLTGSHTRVVWVQDLADGTDIGAAGDQLLLMGYDSHDGRGERPLLADTGQLRQAPHHPTR